MKKTLCALLAALLALSCLAFAETGADSVELAFTRIAFDGKTVSAATDKPARFEVVTSRGVVKEAKGTEVSWTVEKDSYWQGPEYHVFARVRAHAVDGSEEVLFSQPFMLVG